MESGNNFPWEALKADCLRLVCNQVCASSQNGTNSFGKREEMISFLRDVNERGLDSALSASEKSKQVTSTVKRKNSDEDDVDDQLEDPDGVSDAAEAPTNPNSHQAYNTRFKGVKRVKMGREIPEGFPYTPHRRGSRKSAPALLASASLTTTDENGADGRKEDTVKRKRGRPRKNPMPLTRPPTSTTKQVFDGVLVMKRAKRPSLDDHAASHLDPDADAEGEVDGDDEEIVVPHPAELNGMSGVAVENDHHDSNEGDSSIP